MKQRNNLLRRCPLHAPKVLKETSTKVEEDFDWDAFEGTKSTGTIASKQEMTDLYDNTLSILQEKEVVDGKVISMNKREVVVDIGYKSDGIVSVNEFRYNPALKVGDKVEVYVETLRRQKRSADVVTQESTFYAQLGSCQCCP